LIQGDTLHRLCAAAEAICSSIHPAAPCRSDAEELRDSLKQRLDHYKAVLAEHGIPLPF
jgi:hypothetical protein